MGQMSRWREDKHGHSWSASQQVGWSGTWLLRQRRIYRSSKLVIRSAALRPATLDLSLGVPAVGLLLAVATLAQMSAGLMQARKGGTSMTKSLCVICSSLMVTVSSVLINLATASSATPNVNAGG